MQSLIIHDSKAHTAKTQNQSTNQTNQTNDQQGS